MTTTSGSRTDVTTASPPPELSPPLSLREALGELPENVLMPADLHPFLPVDADRFDCGGCEASWVGRGIRPNSAAAFCPTCDYPLFFANRPVAVPRAETRAAQRRLPGVDGRDALGRIVCRGCGEPNPPDEGALCLRCGAYLVPPKPEVVQVDVVREVPVEVVVHDHRWRWIALAALAALTASIAVNVLLALHP
jgi:hypothetical protein